MENETLWNSAWLYDADWWWIKEQILWENRQLGLAALSDFEEISYMRNL